jgi:hypothetical protein
VDGSLDQEVTVASDHVVFATPAFVTADILRVSTQSHENDLHPSPSPSGWPTHSTVDGKVGLSRQRAVSLPQAIRKRRLESSATAQRLTPEGMRRLFSPSVPDLLEEIVYCPVASVITAYPTSMLLNDSSTNYLKAFGHLVPRSTVKPQAPMTAAEFELLQQRIAQQAAKGIVLKDAMKNANAVTDGSVSAAKDKFTTLGTIWSSQLFDGRTTGDYKDYVVFTSFVGGMHSPNKHSKLKGSGESVLAYSDKKLLDLVDAELMELVGKKRRRSAGSGAGAGGGGGAGAGAGGEGMVTLSRLHRLSGKVAATRIRRDLLSGNADAQTILPTTSGDTSDSPFVTLDHSLGAVAKSQPVLLGIKRWERGIPQFEL